MSGEIKVSPGGGVRAKQERNKVMKKAIKWLDDNLEEFLLVLLLLGMAVIMGIQVFSRFALKASLSWTEELTRYLFIWAGFLSLSYCCKRCISIKIEQFVAQFSRRTKAIVKVITHTVELAFFLYMIPYAFMYMMSAVESGQVSPALGMPMVYVQAAPFVSFLLVAFRTVQRWIIEFKVSLGQNVYDPAHPEHNTPESFVKAGQSVSSAETGKESSCR